MIALGSDHGGYELKQTVKNIWRIMELPIATTGVMTKAPVIIRNSERLRQR